MPLAVPFAVGVAGTGIYWKLSGSPESLGPFLADLYYVPIVIAAIARGTRWAITVALAAAALYAIAGIAGHNLHPGFAIGQAILFVGVGVVAAKIAERTRATSPPAKPSAEQPKTPSDERPDDAKVPEELLSRAVTGLVNQLRNPVTSIGGAGWVLEDPKLDEEQRQEIVGIIRKESNRMDRMMSEVLEFARPVTLKVRAVEVEPLIDDAIQLAGGALTTPAPVFRKELAAGMQALPCDAEQFKRALLNVLVNAIQASPSGGLIEVSARVENDQAVIRVRDYGAGIPSVLREKVFEPFFSTHEKSLGLGLPVARQIIAEHGGRIMLEPVSDSGTCVSMFLPLARASVAADA